jgi:pilus assembly protein CpaB
MKRYRQVVLLLLALGSGSLAAYLALAYIREHSTPLMAAEPKYGQVALATHDLPVGAIVGPQDVKLVDWPANARPAGFGGSVDEVVGRGVITAVQQNEPLLATKLAGKGSGGGLPIIIGDGMRAVSVRVDEVVGVAGFVLPGTRVDVLVSLNPPSNAPGEATTRVLLQNVRTIAAGQTVQHDLEGKPQTVTVITLLVTPDQAEALILAATQGRIQLALRGALDTLRTATAGARLNALFGAPPRPAVSVSRVQRNVPIPTPQVQETVVEGIRGAERTLTRFRH